jgi:hypothetical protein
MRITKRQLKRIIKEEKRKLLREQGGFDDDAMKTLINQFDEFTYDAFGEYLIDKRKLQRLSRPAK